MHTVMLFFDGINENFTFNVLNIWSWRKVPDASLEVLLKMWWTCEIFTCYSVNEAFLYVESLI